MISAKAFFALLVIPGSSTFNKGLVDGAGVRSRTLKEKETNALMGLRDLVDADDHFDIIDLLKEAGVHQVSASWECACAGEDHLSVGDGDGAKRDDKEGDVCECQCKAKDDFELDPTTTWQAIGGGDVPEISCHLGFGGE